MLVPLVAAASLAAAACTATPLRREPLPRGSLATIPWVAARPASSGFVGVLCGYDPLLQHGALSLRAQRLDGPGRAVLTVTPVGDASPHPAAGGADRGSLDVTMASP